MQKQKSHTSVFTGEHISLDRNNALQYAGAEIRTPDSPLIHFKVPT